MFLENCMILCNFGLLMLGLGQLLKFSWGGRNVQRHLRISYLQVSFQLQQNRVQIFAQSLNYNKKRVQIFVQESLSLFNISENLKLIKQNKIIITNWTLYFIFAQFSLLFWHYNQKVNLSLIKMSSYTSNSKTPFSGMTLTQIFQIQPLQSLFIKFWYLGLSSESIISEQDQQIFKTIKKNITFANCFSFQMPIKTYIFFMDRIMITLQKYETRKTFDVLLTHLKNNRVMSISFQLFGVAFLQLFGRNLQFMNTQIMNKILRQIFINLTHIGKSGTALLKPSVKSIQRIELQSYIPNLHELIEQKNLEKLQQNPQKVQINFNKSVYDTDAPLNTLKGRLQSQRNHNLQMRQTSADQYPIGQKMRNKQKANLACYMVGGFQIVDYSQSINNLHKKLLTKILLNK